ncbi:site-2 protease family protein [Leucobacter insecticola]|uniref:Site-2 protease family protein n=1 Tax=Leucobacter insecticola TaxID=2714934 RepID=A0A6G8FLE0_9MICO|nr:site-2 protease family protein [Leucobacter insecticola]
MIEVLLYVFGILIIVIGLGVSIALHEIGHLLPAKLFGVKVTQYMIGFGKTLFSWRRGETEYGVKALPLGGYVAMTGMYPPQKPGEVPRASTTGFLNSVVQEGAPKARTGFGVDVQDAHEPPRLLRRSSASVMLRSPRSAAGSRASLMRHGPRAPKPSRRVRIIALSTGFPCGRRL